MQFEKRGKPRPKQYLEFSYQFVRLALTLCLKHKAEYSIMPVRFLSLYDGKIYLAHNGVLKEELVALEQTPEGTE